VTNVIIGITLLVVGLAGRISGQLGKPSAPYSAEDARSIGSLSAIGGIVMIALALYSRIRASRKGCNSSDTRHDEQ